MNYICNHLPFSYPFTFGIQNGPTNAIFVINIFTMRNISLITGIFFLAFYILITFLGWINLRVVFRHYRGLRNLSLAYFLVSLIIILGFTILFIYPFRAHSATNYSLYFIFNSLLILVLFSKIPVALAGLVTLPFYKVRFRYHIAFAGSMLSLGVALAMLWGFTLGPRILDKNHIEIQYENLPDEFDGFRITQLSDFHLGNFNYTGILADAIEENNHFNPHIFLFTGDLVNNFDEETHNLHDYFMRFSSSYGKFAILGNHDYGDYYRWPDQDRRLDNFQGIIEGFGNYGFELLRNESKTIRLGQDSIHIVGVENWGHPPFQQYADLEKAVTGIHPNDFRILLSHDPAHWDSMVRFMPGYPLTLSGHSHGAQWGIKLAGFDFSLISFTRKTWGGLYQYDTNYLYVNKGIGTIGLPFRLDMPPEITFITLRKK